MGILNYLPKFKVVEPNRLTGLVHGHIEIGRASCRERV